MGTSLERKAEARQDAHERVLVSIDISSSFTHISENTVYDTDVYYQCIKHGVRIKTNMQPVSLHKFV